MENSFLSAIKKANPYQNADIPCHKEPMLGLVVWHNPHKHKALLAHSSANTVHTVLSDTDNMDIYAGDIVQFVLVPTETDNAEGKILAKTGHVKTPNKSVYGKQTIWNHYVLRFGYGNLIRQASNRMNMTKNAFLETAQKAGYTQEDFDFAYISTTTGEIRFASKKSPMNGYDFVLSVHFAYNGQKRKPAERAIFYRTPFFIMHEARASMHIARS